MAGEPILIVDDTPVNLKLTRILLANEGYKIQTAGSAEEALELLAGYHPELILADIQLPGMDGLEMTRRVKQDEKTRDITVVALTAFAMKGDEQKALAAGCDGYITKPIDTRTLGKRVREYLDRRAKPGEVPLGPPVSGAVESVTGSEMNALRRRFLTEGVQGTRRLLGAPDDRFSAADAARMVHQWVGTGGLLGYNAIVRISREAQGLLSERPIDTAEVRQALTDLVYAFTCQEEALDLPVPQPILEMLSGKRIVVAGIPPQDAQRLAATLEQVSAKPMLAELGGSEGQPIEACDLAVIYMRPEATDAQRLESIREVAARARVVLVGRREDLIGLNQDVLALADGILMDPWQAEEALVRLTLAISGPRRRDDGRTHLVAAAARRMQVLIACDDPAVLALTRSAFENFGVDYQTAANGMVAMEGARRAPPDAIVLDAGIPGMDGYQVLSAIRAEGPAPILMLANRQQVGEILRGQALGAGDFLFKPFSPMELVARLRRLVV